MRERTHGSREFSNPQVFRSGFEARDVALCFGIPVGHLESESDGLGVDAVCPPDHRRVLELERPPFQHFGQSIKVGRNQGRSLLNQQRLRRIDHIVRSEAVVEPAGVRTYDFGDGGGEGDDVVFDLRLDFKNAFDIERRALADRFGSIFWHNTRGGECFGGGNFDSEPGAEAIFVAPDTSHFGPGIAWNHGDFSCRGTGDCKSSGRSRAVQSVECGSPRPAKLNWTGETPPAASTRPYASP